MRVSALLPLLLVMSACQPGWQTLVPGQEERFVEVVEPAAGELRGDWEWHNAWVDQTGVTVTYGPLGEPPLSCREAPLCLRLGHPSQAAQGDLVAGEFSLRAEARGEGLALLEDGRLVGGVAARLEAMAGFWQSHLVWGMVLIEGGVALLLLLALAGLTVVRIRWQVALAVAGLTAVSFGLRWFAVPVGPFHENHHGLINAHHVVTGGAPFHHVTSAHFALLGPLVRWFGGGETTFYALAALVGALAVPLWGFVARRLGGNDVPGWIAAAAWAVMPLAVRMAPTETPFVLATLLLPAAALTLDYALDNLQRLPGWVALVLAALLLALLAQTRVLTVLLPPASILLALAMPRRFSRRQWFALAGVLVGVGLLIFPHMLDIMQAAEGRAEDARYIGLGNLSESLLGVRMLPFRPAFVSPTLLPLAILGCGWLLRCALRRGVMAMAGLLWLLVVTGLVSTCTSLHVALELPLLAALTALSAVGVFALAGMLPNGPLSWGGAVALVATSLLPWSAFTLAPPETQEYRFIQTEVLPVLAGESEFVLYVAPEDGVGRQAIPVLWWQRKLPAVAVRTWREGEDVPEGAFIYQGLSEIPVAGECQAADEVNPGVPPRGREVAVRRVVPPGDRFLCGEMEESSLIFSRQNGTRSASMRRQ